MNPQSETQPPDDLPAAIAAMREEWGRIEGEVMREVDPAWSEEEKDEFMVRRAELMRGFIDRHEVAMRETGADPQLLDKERRAQSEQVVRRFREADDAVKRGEEELLHKGADLAEALMTMEIELLGMLEQLEALTAEQWEAMEPVQRKNTYEVLLELRETKPQILSELPLEVRREWERRLGD